MDQQTYRVVYNGLYSNNGERTKMAVNGFRHADRSIDGAPRTLDYEVTYQPTFVMLDLGSNRATRRKLSGQVREGDQG